MVRVDSLDRSFEGSVHATAGTVTCSNNPFTPVFGKVPPYLAGRERIIEDVITAFEHPENNPDRCSIFVGARGTGKTALLTYLGYEAENRGWVTADVTAAKGMLDDILQQATGAAAHLVDASPARRLSAVGIAPIGNVSWEAGEPVEANWRMKMSDLLDQLVEVDTGLLITVDEVDPSLDEMVRLVTTFQHFVREGRRVALLMAGLPHRVSALLSGKVTSFLRRAARRNLGPIPRYEVEEALRLTVEAGGRSIDDAALQLAADAIDGFPFMFQLVGYRSWNASGSATSIEREDVLRGIRLAQEEMRDRVFDATLMELSAGDLAFLEAMADDKGTTRQSDLPKRLGKSSSYVSTYKRRLLEAGVIEEAMRGELHFALPGFAQYLREKGVGL